MQLQIDLELSDALEQIFDDPTEIWDFVLNNLLCRPREALFLKMLQGSGSIELIAALIHELGVARARNLEVGLSEAAVVAVYDQVVTTTLNVFRDVVGGYVRSEQVLAEQVAASIREFVTQEPEESVWERYCWWHRTDQDEQDGGHR